MAYSTIKRKKCKGLDCPRYPKLGLNGFCSVKCMPEDVQQLDKWKNKAISHRKAANTSKNSRGVWMAQNDVLGVNEAKNRQELELWFEVAKRELAKKPYCQECGKFIPDRFYRHATAHIFPKNLFPSVATHPMNKLFLGAGCGCHDKTHRLDTFSDMKIFGEAVRRFRLFEKSITEKHKYLDTFLTYVNGEQ